MSGSLRARLFAALAIGSIWLGVLAAPVSAVGQVRWVDDDHQAGDGPNACDTANFHTIQAAINHSGQYDVVKVCPGTYDEQITIDKRGLSVISVSHRRAKIVPPETLVEGDDESVALVRITARDVDFLDFKINIPGGGIIEPGVPTSECTVETAILATAHNVYIAGNLIRGTGDYTLSGECGYLLGIVLTEFGIGAQANGPFGPDTSLVMHNVLRDFKFGGIVVVGDRSARIRDNAIRYVHENDPATCVVTPVIGAVPTATFPCDLTAIAAAPTNVGPLNGFFGSSFGIFAEGALVDVTRNTIYSTFELVIDFYGPYGAFLGVGIALFDAADGSKVRANHVYNTGYGVALEDDTIVLGDPEPPAVTSVIGNRINEGYLGLLVLGVGDTYHANRIHLNLGGIVVEEGWDNSFTNNDARYNYEVDCFDDTEDGGTAGTANYWGELIEESNFGFYNDPEGICLEFGVF